MIVGRRKNKMPSGYTHILLAKTFPEKAGIKNEELGLILDLSMPYFQLGAMAPDLPYSQQLLSLTGRNEIEFADKFHYEKTNLVPIKAFEVIKNIDGTEKDQAFSFFLGFVAHVVADGIIHPYVRDKVGDYNKHNKDAHRILEMHLDVFFLHELTKNSGRSLNLNYTNLHDQILDPLTNFSHVSTLFSKVIEEVYGKKILKETVEEWVRDMHQVFELAESSNNQYYSMVPGLKGFLFKDTDEVLQNHQGDLLLRVNEAKNREINFAGKDIHFFNDCVPSFYIAFKKVALAAYEFVYKGGAVLNESIFPAINLDTGRPLLASSGKDLDSKASYWEMA